MVGGEGVVVPPYMYGHVRGYVGGHVHESGPTICLGQCDRRTEQKTCIYYTKAVHYLNSSSGRKRLFT